jgi:hypothetical protein
MGALLSGALGNSTDFERLISSFLGYVLGLKLASPSNPHDTWFSMAPAGKTYRKPA